MNTAKADALKLFTRVNSGVNQSISGGYLFATLGLTVCFQDEKGRSTNGNWAMTVYPDLGSLAEDPDQKLFVDFNKTSTPVKHFGVIYLDDIYKELQMSPLTGRDVLRMLRIN